MLDALHIARVLDEALSAPLPADEMDDLLDTLEYQNKLAAQLRRLPLQEVEPLLSPSWEGAPEEAA